MYETGLCLSVDFILLDVDVISTVSQNRLKDSQPTCVHFIGMVKVLSVEVTAL